MTLLEIEMECGHTETIDRKVIRFLTTYPAWICSECESTRRIASIVCRSYNRPRIKKKLIIRAIGTVIPKKPKHSMIFLKKHHYSCQCKRCECHTPDECLSKPQCMHCCVKNSAYGPFHK